ncbi:MAG: AAA family ATPase [Desulfovermiculus sp.]|nr:AAA family ATPase [Desulfovermiculus sp.]
MRLDFIEIRNFRRLIATRIDMARDTTLLVGANNSGKTSAITALRCFLLKQKAFSVHDIPISLWERIDELGELFGASEDPDSVIHPKWTELLPSLDVWLTVQEEEIHHVSHLIPTLDWKPDVGMGVRLQLAPRDSQDLLESFSKARKAAADLLSSRATGEFTRAAENTDGSTGDASSGATASQDFGLWPKGLVDYLRKHMGSAMVIKAYILDPAAKRPPVNGVAQPQALLADAQELDGHPLGGLVRVDEVPAHRGLSDYADRADDSEDIGGSQLGRRQLLTAQLRSYYGKHLDPTKTPEPADLRALEAIHEAQTAFDERLRDSFRAPLDELQDLGYPGVTNPRLVVSTQLKPVEGLNHQSAVQYDLSTGNETTAPSYRLPEHCNGLGYQNLISMVFRLIGFRDGWMKVGKAASEAEATPGKEAGPHPLHLVLLEEPEAHLHVQVQQVFIRKAYDVLRRHPALTDDSPLSTQLVVSTHSSHIAHEVDFAQMRYFRRHPARSPGEIPTSAVLNLSEVFGNENETSRFVSRYLRVTHADLFFADGVIMAEGAAERILVPHFVRIHFPALHSCYVTLLEVGGSHAHRLAPLIEHLGVNTLIITDLDAVEAGGHHKKASPAKSAGQLTANNVLKMWHPKVKTVDSLLELGSASKEKVYDPDFSVRVAYQTPVGVRLPTEVETSEAIPRTFEDTLVLENIDLFGGLDGTALLGAFKDAIERSPDVATLCHALCTALDSGSKAGFALDVLYLEDLQSVRVPTYIKEGLEWLQQKLLLRQQEVASDVGESSTAESGGK